MKSQSPLVSIGLRNGAVAGFLSIIFLIAMFYLRPDIVMRSLVFPFLDFRILLFGVFIFFGLKEFRDHYQEGALYFFQGMIWSFIFTVIAGTVSAALLWAFCSFETDFILTYIKTMTEYLNTFSTEDIERIGKTAFDSNLKQLPSTDGKQIAGKYFIQSVMISFFVSIILSVILRKEPKQ